MNTFMREAQQHKLKLLCMINHIHSSVEITYKGVVK